jgi:DNA-binding response OmpR family regulator
MSDMNPRYKRVLVVEDVDDICTLLQCALEDEGFRVETVGDATAARRLVDQSKPDFVILDATLPGPERGTDFAVYLEHLRVPYLMMSGNPDYMGQIARLRFPIMEKPFSTTVADHVNF